MSTDLLDRLGRPYASIMNPELRRGVSPANKGQKYPAEIYSAAEIDAMLRHAGRAYSGDRSRAAVMFMWRCGLRAAEVLALHTRDVDLDEGTVLVRHGKGNQRRMLGLDAQAAAVVRVWMVDDRRALRLPRSGPVFATYSKGFEGGVWGYPQLRNRLVQIADRAGVQKRVHPHGFRHTFAVNLLREGRNAYQIMKALGHNDLATTMRYLDHLFPGEVIEMMQARAWETVEQGRQLTVDDCIAMRD